MCCLEQLLPDVTSQKMRESLIEALLTAPGLENVCPISPTLGTLFLPRVANSVHTSFFSFGGFMRMLRAG